MEMGLYDRIQKLCEDRKISIARLESDCGFSNSTIKKWKATSTPGVDKIKAIAQYFGVTVDYLLGLTEIPTSADEICGDPDIISIHMIYIVHLLYFFSSSVCVWNHQNYLLVDGLNEFRNVHNDL